MLETVENRLLPTTEPLGLPLLERLKRRQAVARKTLQEIDEAIKALESNPEFEHMLNVLGKVTQNF